MANSGIWPTRPLKDCAVWYSGGTPNKATSGYWNGTIPWISAKSLTGFFIADSEERVTTDGVRNGTRLVPENTILFIVRGMSLKSEFRMGITSRPVTFNQDLKALIAVDDVVPAFLAYAIKARTNEILQLVGEAGHGTGVLPTDRIKSVEIPLPPVPVQRAIAHILGTLDDKIELNRRMNETLEATSRALFKSWFVDFDPVRAKVEGRRTSDMDAETAKLFPSAFEDSELGKIPKGWKIVSLADLATVVGGSTPSTKEAGFWEKGVHYWATPKDLSALTTPVLLATERKITEAGLSQIGSGLLPAGTVLLSSRAPIGYLAIAEMPVAINQGFIGMLPCEAVPSPFLLRWAESAHEEIVSRANGSTFLEISKSNFRPILVVRAPPSILAAFGSIAGRLYRRLVANEREGQILANIRDTLLPRLLSGELHIAAAGRIVKAPT